MKSSIKAAVFKRVSLLIGGQTPMASPRRRPWCNMKIQPNWPFFFCIQNTESSLKAIVPFTLFLLIETASCGAFHNIQIRQLDIVVTMSIPFDDKI